MFRRTLVRKGGFEPPRLSAPPPQNGVSASSTTSALCELLVIDFPSRFARAVSTSAPMLSCPATYCNVKRSWVRGDPSLSLPKQDCRTDDELQRGSSLRARVASLLAQSQFGRAGADSLPESAGQRRFRVPAAATVCCLRIARPQSIPSAPLS